MECGGCPAETLSGRANSRAGINAIILWLFLPRRRQNKNAEHRTSNIESPASVGAGFIPARPLHNLEHIAKLGFELKEIEPLGAVSGPIPEGR
jgi:hypothetical protein